MSGGESNFTVSDSGFDQNDIKQFMSDTGTDASALLNAKLYTNKSNGKTFYGASPSSPNNTDIATSSSSPFFSKTYPGQDLTPLSDSFTAWKQKRDAVNQMAGKYVELKKQDPGREATILTDPSKTILGMPKTSL